MSNVFCIGKYVASNINSLGSNRYSVTLLINDIVVGDDSHEYSLHIAVADTKNINLPFMIDVEESVELVNIPPKLEVDEAGRLPITVVEPGNTKEENKTVASLGPKDVVVKQESISVFIIIGIIALCIIICILYYASRCCSNQSEEEDDIEKNTNTIDRPETKPLIKKVDETNSNIDVSQLNDNLESKLEPEKKELSFEERKVCQKNRLKIRKKFLSYF